jgi:hypothetical protein
MNKVPAGVWTFCAWLVMFGLAHAVVAAIDRAGLAGIFYYVFLVAGLVLLLVSVRTRPAAQSVLGGLAGLCFWSAVGEIGEGGELYENPRIWGVVLLVLIFLALRPGTRCDVFARVQRWLRLPVSSDHTGWRAPAVAFEFFFIVWTGHMLMLTGYYAPGLGIHSWLTNAVLIFSAVCSPFLLFLQYRTRAYDLAWSRAIPTVVVFWMGLEVLMKWRVVPKPWV